MNLNWNFNDIIRMKNHGKIMENLLKHHKNGGKNGLEQVN